MSTTLDFQLREALPHLSKNARLNVLVALILHANIRNRCYPSLDWLCVETGFGIEAVNKAKSWLIDVGAIERVPYAQRVGREKALPPRQTVYQLTGIMTIEGKTYAYLYDPTRTDSAVNPSVSETSDTEGKVFPSIKNVHKTRKESAASIEDRAHAAAPADETASVKAHETGSDVTAPSSLSAAASLLPTPPRARSAAQLANDALVEALRQAYFTARKLPVQELGRTDYGNYQKRAKELIDGGIAADQFQAYIEYWHKAAVNGGWTLTLNSLTSGGRMADYKAFAARGQTSSAPRAYDRKQDPAYAPLLQGGSKK
jgi:hypothetical protein